MQSSRGTEGGERREGFVSRGSGTEREARGGERREGAEGFVSRDEGLRGRRVGALGLRNVC